MKYYNILTKDGFVIGGMKATNMGTVIKLLKIVLEKVFNEDKINQLDEIIIREIGKEQYEFGKEMDIQTGGIIGRIEKLKG